MAELTKNIDDVKLNDRWIRLIGIPFFGIAIPNISGLFGPLNYTNLLYWLGYIFFIALAALISTTSNTESQLIFSNPANRYHMHIQATVSGEV